MDLISAKLWLHFVLIREQCSVLFPKSLWHLAGNLVTITAIDIWFLLSFDWPLKSSLRSPPRPPSSPHTQTAELFSATNFCFLCLYPVLQITSLFFVVALSSTLSQGCNTVTSGIFQDLWPNRCFSKCKNRPNSPLSMSQNDIFVLFRFDLNTMLLEK